MSAAAVAVFLWVPLPVASRYSYSYKQPGPVPGTLNMIFARAPARCHSGKGREHEIQRVVWPGILGYTSFCSISGRMDCVQ